MAPLTCSARLQYWYLRFASLFGDDTPVWAQFEIVDTSAAVGLPRVVRMTVPQSKTLLPTVFADLVAA